MPSSIICPVLFLPVLFVMTERFPCLSTCKTSTCAAENTRVEKRATHDHIPGQLSNKKNKKEKTSDTATVARFVLLCLAI